MADVIQHKRSATAAAVPSAGQLALGELAINVADGRLFLKKANGVVVDVTSIAGIIGLTEALAGKVNNSDVDFTIIYPNGGTEVSPANVAVNSRYVLGNPFAGNHILCLAEVLHGGVWGATGWYSDPSFVLGVHANSYGATEIVVQTGRTGLLTTNAYDSGSPFPTGSKPSSLPCRVKVWKVKGAV